MNRTISTMTSIAAIRSGFIGDLATLGTSTLTDPDMTNGGARRVILTLKTGVEAYRTIALINSSSISEEYFFSRDLPQDEREALKRAEYALKALTTLYGAS